VTAVYYLVGPTGSGKTQLALRLAPALNAEVLNADAYQIYRGLELLTAAPTAAERCAGQGGGPESGADPDRPPLAAARFPAR